MSNIIIASFLISLGAGFVATSATAGATGATATTVPAKKAQTAAESSLLVKRLSKVSNIELIEKKGGVIVRVHVSDKTEFTHQIEPAKDGKPYRIILDCQNAIHYLGENRFMTLPNTVIKSIRTSQYAVQPKRVCRVVLDLRKEAFYKVQAWGKYIDLFVTDPSVKPFDSWSTASFLAAKKARNAATKSLAQGTATTKAQEKKPASVASTTVKAPQASSAKLSKQAKQPVTVAKTTPKTTAKTAANVSVKKTVSQKSVASSAKDKAPVSSGTSNKYAKADKKTITVATTTPKVKAVPKKTASKPAKSSVSKTTVSPVVAKLSKSGPADKKSSTKAQTAKKSATSQKPVKKASPTLASAAKKNTKSAKSSSKTSVKNPKKSPVKSGKKAQGSKSSSSLFASNVQAAIKPSVVQKANKDRGYSAKFRRSVDKRAIKLKGTQVAEFPKRLTIKYKSRGTRDPFASLFDKKKDKNRNMLDPRPNVESLTMVGVSRDVDGKTRGLFEDIDGRGYILSKGDRVEHGTVIKVTSKKTYFQIFEYGWSRTVALSLEG